MSNLYKFIVSGTAIQQFEFDDGTWKPEDLHRNETITIDPVTLDVVVTSTFETFTKVETYGQTPDMTDDASVYLRTSRVFTSRDGTVIPSSSGGSESGDDHGGGNGGNGSDDLYKFEISGTTVAGFEFDDGAWKPEHLRRNQTISVDPATQNVVITSTFETFIKVETYSQTPDVADDASLYVRTSRVFTALDGTALPTDPRDSSRDEARDGTSGKDRFDGGRGNDRLDGGDGNDKIGGDEGDDDLIGGNGNDTIAGGAGLDVITGDDGNDKLGGGADDDVIDGGAGKDSVTGGTGDDTLNGGSGSDGIKGGSGEDDINGDDGDDTLGGDDGDDTLLGGLGNDKLDGGKGNDHLLAGEDAGNDKLGGGAGEDVVDYSAASTGLTIDLGIGVAFGTSTTAASGADKLMGIEDVLGSTFDDVIIGSKDSNKLAGGDGNDTLTGSKGADTLTGGAGSDVFAFTSVKDSDLKKTDVITDFTAGADSINLSAIDAVKGVSGSAFTFSNAAPVEGEAAGVVWFNSATHTLYASINADAKAEIAISLTAVDAVTAADLVL
ncbi:M10 family metallopeptidase C-terminal domain-containing protein [Novosphingobium sp. PASSN1]|uniref:calcium-binding protein n=1 Tax=Novosphingobium sp. PASSN1 TaxID=2015561 RepID=UPI0025E9993B|nr:M10 family metallopeptidase C-terminal domain-containing protein [Novosphingobium sp. PASSN1]